MKTEEYMIFYCRHQLKISLVVAMETVNEELCSLVVCKIIQHLKDQKKEEELLTGEISRILKLKVVKHFSLM